LSTPPKFGNGSPHRNARYYRAGRRRRLWPAVLGWAVWLVLGFVALGMTAASMALEDTLERAAPDTADAREARRTTTPVLPGQQVVNILLIGSDVRDNSPDAGNGLSDTLMLLRMDQRNQFVSMLAIPRDLVVNIPDHGRAKVNAAYSYSTATAIRTVKELIGQPINYYVRVDFQAFYTIVQELGGVYVDVDRHYFHQNQGTAGTNFAPIDIGPGYQRLNGNDALDYVRFRHFDSTTHRMARQQTFLAELKRQLEDSGPFKNFATVRKVLGDGIEMDITNPREFLGLLNLALSTPKDRIARTEIEASLAMDDTLGSIQIASDAQVQEAVAQWLEPDFEQSSSAPRRRVPPPARLNVSVLNGNGKLLAAEKMAGELAKLRYNVQVAGNAEDFEFPATTVYWAPGLKDAAARLRNQIGGDARIAALSARQAGGNHLAVAVGHDFTGALNPTRPRPQVRERAPADVVHSTSLVEPMREAQREAGFRAMVPTAFARGSEVRIIRSYRAGMRDNSGPPAVKVVVAMPNASGEYWGVMMTTERDPAILQGETGTDRLGTNREYRTYYEGRNLQRIAFTQGGVTYWISNTLMHGLSAKTMEEIAKSMRPLNNARLPKGVTDTAIPVETDGRTR
jgi:LCP family protein required for cell wall assembly